MSWAPFSPTPISMFRAPELRVPENVVLRPPNMYTESHQDHPMPLSTVFSPCLAISTQPDGWLRWVVCPIVDPTGFWQQRSTGRRATPEALHLVTSQRPSKTSNRWPTGSKLLAIAFHLRAMASKLLAIAFHLGGD